jgi:hypothetical protein
MVLRYPASPVCDDQQLANSLCHMRIGKIAHSSTLEKPKNGNPPLWMARPIPLHCPPSFAYFALLVEILLVSSYLTDFDFGCFSLLDFDGLCAREVAGGSEFVAGDSERF